MRYEPYQPERETPQQFAERVFVLHKQLIPQLPDLDPSDVLHILEAMLRPLGTGREWLLLEQPDGSYVF